MVSLMSGTLGESSNESLEALVLGSLQVVTPVGVSLIWICRCAPLRLAAAVRSRRRGAPQNVMTSRRWHGVELEIAAAACSGMLLAPWFELGVLLGGMLTTPRAGFGLASELQELIRLMTASDLLQCVLRAGMFTAAAQGVCLRKAAQFRDTDDALARLLADAIPQCLLVVMALEVIWLTLLVPLHGTYA